MSVSASLKKMNKDERSLLLFFENACVEHGGWLHHKHMNEEDLLIATQWAASGFIKEFRRLKMAVIRKTAGKYSHTCWLSPSAWSIAQAERRARAKRIRDRRKEEFDA